MNIMHKIYMKPCSKSSNIICRLYKRYTLWIAVTAPFDYIPQSASVWLQYAQTAAMRIGGW